MKYVKTNKDGVIEGFYESDISKPPKGSVKITQEDWQEAVDIGANHFDGTVFSVKKEPLNKEVLANQLMFLADTKQEDAEGLILGYKATPKQIERYKDKYERAKEGEFDDATNQIIIQKFEAMRSAIRQFTDMIEEYRGFVDDLIQAGELDKAEKAIEAGRSFRAETTREDIMKLLGGL